ncbi:MAG: 2-oxo acid dehydrogenase subunit E2 [Bacteroidota bacterium]|nr:2-oxo acid dehydrogenase subunit E2 [Bacteroidota bacterium]
MYKENKLNYFRWSLGDRYDGWRLRKVDPMFSVAPFILKSRVDSQVLFEIKVPIEHIEKFIRLHKEEIPGLSIMHVVIAALVRLMSQRPNLNRFVVWHKIFARNHMNFSIAVKRSLSDTGEETIIKPYFLPGDTLQDIVRKTNLELANTQKDIQDNSTDSLSRILGFFPDFMLRSLVFVFTYLDKIGLMPRSFNHASPFHASFFLTNLGSIGIESIYHHLYEFGTCSLFVAMGKKTKESFLEKDGEVKTQKSILLKFVLDERICDGFYYARSMRTLEKILSEPSELLIPPKKVFVDAGVGKKRIDK